MHLALHLHLKVATFELELPACIRHTALVLKSRNFQAKAAKTLQTEAEEKRPILADTIV